MTLSLQTKLIYTLSLILMMGILSPAMADNDLVGVDNNLLYKSSTKIMTEAIEQEKEWVKVHAAEGLVYNNHIGRLRETFLDELKKNPSPTYKIGIWRVLVQVARNDQALKREYLNKIIDAAKTPSAPNRDHALETLGKLKWFEDVPEITDLAQNSNGSIQVNARWVMANSGTPESEASLAELLTSPDSTVRGSTAYALRYLNSLQSETLSKLREACWKESSKSSARVYLLSALYVHADSEDHKAEKEKAKSELLKYVQSGTRDEKNELCCALAAAGDMSDIGTLQILQKDKQKDVNIYASNAVLRIIRRRPTIITEVDWVIIALYAIGMLLVGYFYSKKTKKTEDYLLGGRNMKPWAVGLSLFATLLSTLSYLAMPGEIIQHGPMVLTSLLAYPLIFFVVGWFLIPFIMKLKITSAYELLELRLGISVRMLGTFFFLSLRLLWMAMIIYVTTDAVLLPMMGISAKWLPLVCTIIGLITVIYTSMGGLKAVVFTDVIQSFILFFGAILSLILISSSLGGVGEWFPTQWDPNWDKLNFNIDPNARFTVGNAVMMSFLWFVCTMGSDQMAIQRYLATRDAKAARNTLAMSLGTGALVTILLGGLGFALLGYFSMNPQLIPDGQTLREGADQLFPRFVVTGLPAGITGLVVAGLLAAAMSSLSSGMNSASSVVVVDFIDRFRHKPLEDTEHIRMAKWGSVAVGVAVVLLSLLVGQVEGNLFEAINKVVNLFVSPLFVLFFMAMFVPWSNSFGTLVGAACSVAIAIGIAFFGFLGLSFIWIMPGSLLVGILVGMVASLVGPHNKCQ